MPCFWNKQFITIYWWKLLPIDHTFATRAVSEWTVRYLNSDHLTYIMYNTTLQMPLCYPFMFYFCVRRERRYFRVHRWDIERAHYDSKAKSTVLKHCEIWDVDNIDSPISFARGRQQVVYRTGQRRGAAWPHPHKVVGSIPFHDIPKWL